MGPGSGWRGKDGARENDDGTEAEAEVEGGGAARPTRWRRGVGDKVAVWRVGVGSGERKQRRKREEAGTHGLKPLIFGGQGTTAENKELFSAAVSETVENNSLFSTASTWPAKIIVAAENE